MTEGITLTLRRRFKMPDQQGESEYEATITGLHVTTREDVIAYLAALKNIIDPDEEEPAG